ncbi:hypothetical protein M0R45_014514 [Rubus argutus]|uniref:Secreted protein n=1 Tax=Rubus argutus TaxID=59490 RepID=A0AAW1XQ55_RUBAR
MPLLPVISVTPVLMTCAATVQAPPHLSTSSTDCRCNTPPWLSSVPSPVAPPLRRERPTTSPCSSSQTAVVAHQFTRLTGSRRLPRAHKLKLCSALLLPAVPPCPCFQRRRHQAAAKKK